MMHDATTLERHELLPVEQALETPFPRKYVHSVFVDVQAAQKAAQALRAAHFDERDIYVLESREFVEAVSRGHSFLGFLTSMAYDVYLNEASQGRAFLAVRPRGYAQLNQISRSARSPACLPRQIYRYLDNDRATSVAVLSIRSSDTKLA